MKAIHKYKHAAARGNKEAKRRIAQSLGYKHTIYDDPKMIALLYRAGIEIDGIDYKGEVSTEIVQDINLGQLEAPDTTTLKL